MTQIPTYSHSYRLNEIGHGKVHDVVSPGQLEDDVQMKKIVALEEARREAAEGLLIQKVGEQLLSHLKDKVTKTFH